MSDQQVTDAVRRFYEEHQFPGNRPLDQDGLILMRRFGICVDERTHTNGRTPVRVCDAGCGTGNTSIALARRFGAVRFLGMDSCRASLRKACDAAEPLEQKNLQFRQWDLMKPAAFRDRFDIVLCLGVLHHTADMKQVMKNLHCLLKGGGSLFLWIYGKHGRYRHSLNMQLLKMLLGPHPSPQRAVEVAREFVHRVPDGSVMTDLLGSTTIGALEQRAFDDPVWIADQFLHPHETLIEMKELLRLVRATGFVLDHVVGMDDGMAKRLGSPALQEQFHSLSREKRLIALDLLLKPERYFVLLRKPQPAGKR